MNKIIFRIENRKQLNVALISIQWERNPVTNAKDANQAKGVSNRKS